VRGDVRDSPSLAGESVRAAVISDGQYDERAV
jgi:hypothetical protein